MNFKIVGCVILYKPNADVVENVASYIDYIDLLYVVDNQNGDAVIKELSQRYQDKIVPIKHKENMGISFSLNEVLELANDKYDLLLTMDQDSRFSPTSMFRFKNEVTKFEWEKTLAVGAAIKDFGFNEPTDVSLRWKKTVNMITSGSIVSVKNALAISGYDEDLFIDEVDSDFCFRGIKAGYELYTNTSGIYLLHSLGNPSYHKFFGHVTKVQNHNKIRKYYIFRNRLVILFRHGKMMGAKRCWNYYIKANINLIRDVVFFEDDELEKINYIVKGLLDFLTGRLGKRV